MTEIYETCLVDVADYVATVTINLPPVNAQNGKFREEITRIFDSLGQRPDVRAIVLTGQGKLFSAGADLKDRPDPSVPGAYTTHGRKVREAFNCVMECEKPVIAALNGGAIGAGCVLALCCDIIVAADDAYLSMTEVDYVLAGGVAHVRRHFGESDARLMIYTARRVTGQELLRMRVASMSVPRDELMETAQGIARQIASKSPLAVRAAKKSFLVTENQPLQEGYKFEQSQTAMLATTADFKEAQAAFREKRKPTF
ncbi:enoyl-CoA hydratase/isomerase family protein [Bradyrhizobium sp. AUGA SZCCT0431]|uniref:enoyl-CoA hydratase/isomerase family protein n=1 Tax=Bradyrhizobium sp. AUGA SZCCT0431 TaxID=2807674 RepID=UPI001BADFC01|nr:enoyl-CoA hydratase/isomerase family protein [Bradyrhizobium sp. AUGA SZCCT0431]MBR1147288.1 enoyl-CoA hydratase/isomerase family protein [Bradyrhizobium sp. AUGA SZCCT0431]